jgi:hypothetical protein
MDRRAFLQSLSIAPFWSGRKGRSLPDIGGGPSAALPAAVQDNGGGRF